MMDTQRECCEYYYGMNVQGCMHQTIVKDPCSTFEVAYLNIYDENYLREEELEFYPDFESDDKYCVSNEEAPQYMIRRAAEWKKPTVEACCRAYFPSLFRECIDDSYNEEDTELDLTPCTQQPEVSGKWYVKDYGDGGEGYMCVRECHGRPPCAGRAQWVGLTLYDTYELCCRRQTWVRNSLQYDFHVVNFELPPLCLTPFILSRGNNNATLY